MHHTYRTQDTCAIQIDFDLDNNIISNLKFTGGCNGNLKAIAKLLEGQTADYAISKLKGNTCGYKKTSCADQLARALQEAKKI